MSTVIRSIIVMGPCGCGKSTLGQALALRLAAEFIEGDSLHPPENVAKMRANIALDDDDRVPFIRNVADALARITHRTAIASCSALKRSYRDQIRKRVPNNVMFVLPMLSREQLRARLEQRRQHFLPASMLDGQLAILELPERDEWSILVEGSAPIDAQVDAVIRLLRK